MIKTLRITTIVAAVLAVIFFFLSVVFGGRSDKEIEHFLNSSGVVEKFNKAADNKVKTSQNETSPLITQAEAFVKYLNPPPKPKPSTPTIPKPTVSPPRPRGPVTAKFTLAGTSFYEANPELSLAFINEPGKDLRWVRQGSTIGHLVIEQVKDGLIVVRDGQRTFEITTQQKPQRSPLLEPLAVPTKTVSITHPAPAENISHEDDIATTASVQQMKEKSEKMLEEFLNSIQNRIESGEINMPNMENPSYDFGKMRISDDEAKKLQRLPLVGAKPAAARKELDSSRRSLTEPERDTRQNANQANPQDTLRRSRKVKRSIKLPRPNRPQRKR